MPLTTAASKISPYPIMQMGWSVFEDIELASKRWAVSTGAGPFFVMRHVPMLNCVHHGNPRPYDHSCAIGNWGDIQIELMQQHCANPSHIRDISPDGKPRLASISWVVPDIDAEIARLLDLGFPVAWTGTLFEEGGMVATWIDTRDLLGCYVELFAEHPKLRQVERRCREASIGWNGDRPVREMSELLAGT